MSNETKVEKTITLNFTNKQQNKAKWQLKS